MKRLNADEILVAVAAGVLVGVVVTIISGMKVLVSPLCLILAIALCAYAFWRPNFIMLVVAVVAGFLIGGWRSANYLMTAGSGSSSGTVEKSLLAAIREDYAESIKNNIEGEEESALGISYLLGMKEGLSEEITEALSIVGLTHIVVASGTHLSILVDLTRKIFGKLSRAAGVIFAILFIIIFASMIGWTASITRAAVVSILALTMGYVGRKFQAWRLILFAMAITLMMNPANLTALGWQLSFAAYTGIILLAPQFKRIFYGDDKKPGLLAETLIASMSATLLCLPLQLYFFGDLSLLALPANLLILPTIPYAMGLTFLAGMGGFLAPLGKLAGWGAGLLLKYHLLVIRFLAEQKMFVWEMEPYQAWVLWLYLLIALSYGGLWWWGRRKSAAKEQERCGWQGQQIRLGRQGGKSS